MKFHKNIIKQKSSKILNTSKSILKPQEESADLEIKLKIKELKQKSKRQQNIRVKSISPINTIKLLSPVKSVTGIHSIKFPLKSQDSVNIKDLKTSQNSKNTLTSVSPKFSLQKTLKFPSALKESKTLSSTYSNQTVLNKNLPLIISKSCGLKQFKNFDLRKELEINENLIEKKTGCLGNSCLDNLVSLDELKTNSRTLEHTLKCCTGIIKDFIIRMDNLGFSSEGVLLDKL